MKPKYLPYLNQYCIFHISVPLQKYVPQNPATSRETKSDQMQPGWGKKKKGNNNSLQKAYVGSGSKNNTNNQNEENKY